MKRISIPSIVAYLLVFLLALVFTLQCVHCSVHYGRLVSVPNYDDVVYFSSGLDFAKKIHTEGFYGIIDHYIQQGTHAPYSELLAGIVIFFCGYLPRAVYTSDVFLVFTYLCFIRYFLNRLPPFSQVILLLCFLTFPFATMAVVEFRPDLAWATLLGFACVYLVTRKDFFEELWPSFVVATLIICALLAKPATFPMTLLLPTFAFFGRLAIEFLKPNLSIKGLLIRAATQGLIIFSLIIVIMSPYIYWEGSSIWSYFWDNTWGKNAILWKYTGDDMWTFYLYGQGYENNINTSGLIFLSAILILTLVYIRKLSWADIGEIVVGLGLMFTAYVINSKAPVKSPFMGGAIYGTEIFLLAHIVGRVLPEAMTLFSDGKITKIYSPIWLKISTVFLLVACVATYKWPPYSYWDPDRGQFLQGAHAAVFKYFSEVPEPKSICLTHASPIVVEDLSNWFHARNEYPHLDSAALALTFEDAIHEVNLCQYVICQNAGIRENTGWLQAEIWQDKIVNQLLKSPDYALEVTFSDKRGKNLYVFKHQDTASIPLPEFNGGTWTLEGDQLAGPSIEKPITVGPISQDLSWKLDLTALDNDKNEVSLTGWSGNTKIGLPTKEILMFSGTKLEKVIPVNVARQDVADSFGAPSLLQSGFKTTLPVALVKGPDPLTFIAVLNGQPAVDQTALLPFDKDAFRSSLGLSKETSVEAPTLVPASIPKPVKGKNQRNGESKK